MHINRVCFFFTHARCSTCRHLNSENDSSFLCCLHWANSQWWGGLRWGGAGRGGREGECDVKCLASGREDETMGDMPAFFPMAKKKTTAWRMSDRLNVHQNCPSVWLCALHRGGSDNNNLKACLDIVPEPLSLPPLGSTRSLTRWPSQHSSECRGKPWQAFTPSLASLKGGVYHCENVKYCVSL